MAKEVILTYARLKELEAELEYLKTEQGEVEVKIVNLEKMLKSAKVIDEDEIDTSKVVVGTKVKILDIDFNEEAEYEIVGSTEANPATGKISDESPLGKALLGAVPNDVVKVISPNGEYEVKVLSISK